MSVRVISEAELMREVSQILMQHLTPTRLARYWASWHGGQGDYLTWRDETFAGDTLDHLYEEIVAYQQSPDQQPDEE